ncbi:unnamed protein product [Choristocarpus tenellus]
MDAIIGEQSTHVEQKQKVLPLPEDMLSSVLLFLRTRDLFEWRKISKSATPMFASEGHVKEVSHRLLVDLHSSRDKLNTFTSLSASPNTPTMNFAGGKNMVGRKRCLNIGHKGAAGHVTGNTISSFVKAIELGVDMIEFDVLTTLDGVVACHHDPLIEETGEWVADLTLSQIRARLNHDICTFEDMLRNKTLVSSGVHLYVDMKHINIVRPVMHLLRHAVSRWGWTAERLLVATFRQVDLLQVNAFRRTIPELMQLRTVSLLDGVPLTLAKEFEALEVDVISVGKDHLTRELVEDTHRRGMKIYVWTVNSSAYMTRVMAMGADGICTDFPQMVTETNEKYCTEKGESKVQQQLVDVLGNEGDFVCPPGREESAHYRLLGMVYNNLTQVRYDAVEIVTEAKQVLRACKGVSAVTDFLAAEVSTMISEALISSVQILVSQAEDDAEQALRPVITSAEVFKWSIKLMGTVEGREFLNNVKLSIMADEEEVNEAGMRPYGPMAMLPFELSFVHDLLGLGADA